MVPSIIYYVWGYMSFVIFSSIYNMQSTGRKVTYNYSISLQPIVFNGYVGDFEDVVTSELIYTFNIQTDVLADYSPTVRVNIPGARPVNLSSDRIR